MTQCANCEGEGWVCENHPQRPWGWGEGCCGGAGMPCLCNKADPPWHFISADEIVDGNE